MKKILKSLTSIFQASVATTSNQHDVAMVTGSCGRTIVAPVYTKKS